MLEARDLHRRFGSIHAVKGVSFKVDKGEVLGFLGPNGAGKSTTMRMITGFIPPTKGTATVCGFDVVANPVEAKRHIGYLPENAPVYEDMTVIGFLSFAAAIRGFTGSERTARISRAVELCRLERVLHQQVETLSKGYRHRTCLAQAVIHDPPILIMDEPTDGLDPNQKHVVRAMIREMAREKAIILSTHILEEVDAVCTRVIVIADGAVVADSTPAELKARSRWHGAVELVIEDEGKDWTAELKALPSAASARRDGPRYTVFPSQADRLAADVAALLRDRRVLLSRMHVAEGRLDEVFRELTAGREQIRKAS
jgi:ABC-2 type transport system ATP-binding protein